MWYTYTMEYESAIRKNEIILFEGKQMELEIIRLSEVNQVQKRKGSHVFSHMWKTEPKDKYIHKYKHNPMYLYLYIYKYI
jgi:hypothetical protein